MEFATVVWNNAVSARGSPQDSKRFWKTDQVVICDISRNIEATVVPLCSIVATPDILYNWNSLFASIL